MPLYHPDARAWEVKDTSGRHVGLFIGDYFARGSKHSRRLDDLAARPGKAMPATCRPVILNVCNFSKPAAGEPALLSFDDARTLFHEFGHALHGLLSNVTYPLLAGTAVPSDFVELPSQLYEHWLEVPEILQKYARHAATGEPMPKALLDRLLATRTFNQGFATVEYTACALVDLDIHALPEHAKLDVGEFERDDLAAHRRCRRKSSCATACRISSICSPAAAMRRAITPTCGRRCSTPTPSRPSRKPATPSIPQPPSACATSSTAPATCAIRRRPTKPSAAACRAVDALLKKRGLADAVPA